MIDSGGYRGPEHADSRLPVRRRPGGELARQLHRAIPRPPNPHPAKREDRHHFLLPEGISMVVANLSSVTLLGIKVSRRHPNMVTCALQADDERRVLAVIQNLRG